MRLLSDLTDLLSSNPRLAGGTCPPQPRRFLPSFTHGSGSGTALATALDGRA